MKCRSPKSFDLDTCLHGAQEWIDEENFLVKTDTVTCPTNFRLA